MLYESKKTQRGNVGVSFESQEAADLQASQMDANGCSDCYDCYDCSDCSYCRNCRHSHDCYDCYGCHNCRNCHDCYGCRNCYDCSGCSRCSGCSYCRNCRHSHGCYDCSDCSFCSSCYDCSDCSDCYGCRNCSGVLHWSGSKAERLLAINGLTWPVATDGKSIQIGCQHHSVEAWRGFGDDEIDAMEERALEFWQAHKDQILLLAEMRRSMEVEECQPSS